MSIKDFGSRFRPNSSSKNVLESLMKQMKINCKLKNELLDAASKGKGLAFVPKQWIEPVELEKPELKRTIKLPRQPLQRMKSTIVESGAYEVEKYRPNPALTRPSKEKERLQNIMAFGKETDMDENCSIQSEERPDISINPTDTFNEILMEIKERRNFLNDMKDLGLEKKYLPEIQFQIALRFKELEKLDQERAEKVFQKYGM